MIDARRRLTVAWALALALCLVAREGAAAGGDTGSVEQLAQRLAETIARRAESPVALYVEAPGEGLQRGVATGLAAALAERKHAVVPLVAASPADAETKARRLGARSLIRVAVSLEQGELRAQGDLLGTWVNFWSGELATRPPRPAAVFSEAVPVDALAIGMASSPLPPSALRLEVLAELPLRPAAVAAGDLDGDGRDELAVLTDEEVWVLRGDGTVLARRSHLDLRDSATPSREPFGAVAIDPRDRQVLAFSARRARGEAVRLERGALVPAAQLSAPPITAELVAQFVPGQNVFAPVVKRRGDELNVGAPFHSIVHRAGQWLTTHPDAVARWLPRDAAPAVLLTGLGASTLADLDADGRPELVTSSPDYAPDPETLRGFELPREPAAPDAEAKPPHAEPGPGAPLPVARLAERMNLTFPEGRVLLLAPANLDGQPGDEVIVGVWLPDGRGRLLALRRPTR